MVEKLLENERVEVREKAGEVLSGLLHCGFISNPTDLLVSCLVIPNFFSFLVLETFESPQKLKR